MDSPFLDDSFFIKWSQLVPEAIEPDISAALEEAEANIAALTTDVPEAADLTFENTLGALETATEKLYSAWGKVGHLDSVRNNDAQREAYNAMLPKVSEFGTGISLNAELYARIEAYSTTDEAKSLTGAKKRLLDETLADFRENGAALPADKKERLEEVQAELAQITQKFSENVLDSTNAWELIVTDESRLAGLPKTAKATLRGNAKAKDLGTDDEPVWRIILQVPSYFPVLEYCHDASLRKEVWEGSSAVGAEGKYDNTALIWDILRLRQEKAEILGKANFADKILERRMAKTGQAALDFTEELYEKCVDAFKAENDELRQFRADETGEPVDDFEPWDVTYWAERQRKAKYAFDDEDLRPYFAIDQVLSGMFEIAQQVFGITIDRRDDAAFAQPGSGDLDGKDVPEVWHPEVKFYNIKDSENGAHLGSFYADWHPRESKRGGAWMNYLMTGEPATHSTPRGPHLGLICGNMTPSSDGVPALLTHNEVETIFHEFGHLLHHLLGEVEVKSLNGVNVVWDFVELPSQIMENFCWDRRSLDLFATHYETGEVIPDELFDKMVAARNYRAGNAMMRQLGLGKMDLELHINHATAGPDADLDALVRDDILDGYLMKLKTQPPSMARRFSHLFSSPTGYAAGYYSYKWAEVLDADAFTKFADAGVLCPVVGKAFREEVLSKGNSADAAELFRNFMGRDPDVNALLVRSGLVA